MGAKGNSFITDWLNLLFNNTNIANLGDAGGVRGSVAAGSLYFSLHTADPGVNGNQTTSEAAYTGYTRVAVARTAGGWTITAQSVSPTSTVIFPPGSAGGETCTWGVIGRDFSGAGKILYKGLLTPSITTGNGITPEVPNTSTVTEA